MHGLNIVIRLFMKGFRKLINMNKREKWCRNNGNRLYHPKSQIEAGLYAGDSI